MAVPTTGSPRRGGRALVGEDLAVRAARLVCHVLDHRDTPVPVRAWTRAAHVVVSALESSFSQSVASLPAPPPQVCRQYRTQVFAGSAVWKMRS